MPTTVGAFTAIDDGAIDAERPITESLMTALRDNAYWIIAGTTKTTESAASKFLETAGSGALQWTESSTLGVDGTKGAFAPASTSSGTPDQVAIISNKKLQIFVTDGTGGTYYGLGYVDSSDDSFIGIGVDVSSTYSFSGTADGSFKSFIPANTTGGGDGDGLKIKKNGSNYEFYNSDSANGFIYIWL